MKETPHDGAGEVAALALPEAPSSVPSTHGGQLSITSKVQLQQITLLASEGTCRHVTNAHIHKQVNKR